MLTILESIPAGFLAATARDLHQIIPGPTLLHLPGKEPRPLFVSVLLHGNETTGLAAVQRLLHQYGINLPRALSLFIGNVTAAREGLRALDGQPDYNRIWPGTLEAAGTPEAAMARRVFDEMRQRQVFASIDVHNNTGTNPHYACINRLAPEFLQMATLFGRTVLYFIKPDGVQTKAFASLCPAVTVECGKPGAPAGEQHAFDYLSACLRLKQVPDHPVAKSDLHLFHTVTTVKVSDGASLGFGDGEADIMFPPHFDQMNFSELPENTAIARIRPGSRAQICALDEAGNDVSARFFRVENDVVRTRRCVMPAMLTLDARIVHQDCLCYFMERLAPPKLQPAGA